MWTGLSFIVLLWTGWVWARLSLSWLSFSGLNVDRAVCWRGGVLLDCALSGLSVAKQCLNRAEWGLDRMVAWLREGWVLNSHPASKVETYPLVIGFLSQLLSLSLSFSLSKEIGLTYHSSNRRRLILTIYEIFILWLGPPLTCGSKVSWHTIQNK